ncbi:hypothetical protein EV382_3922 [Micromonospora violae]|uniref:Uncharacterized protein n=1 Tax=Micromonospora violae TaxID=1278207 RepID=A0A4Q7UID2_9ACTN|nr:hypothetical protein EV382_3922 [Micromonospora violae]
MRAVRFHDCLLSAVMTLAWLHRPTWSCLGRRYVCRCGAELPCRSRHRIPWNQPQWPGEHQ